MAKLNHSLEKAHGDYCDICWTFVADDDYYLKTDPLSPYGADICLPCIDKIRTELIKKNPGVKLL